MEDRTRELILNAAGPLFAERGFKGVAVRDITRAARAKVAAVNYHFGTKQRLYAAALSEALRRSTGVSARELAEAVGDVRTRAGMARFVHRFIRCRLESFFAADRPAWCRRLAMRELAGRTPALDEVVRAMFEPDFRFIAGLLRRLQPSLSKAEVELWVFSLVGPVAFYSLAEEAVHILRGRAMDAGFLARVAAHSTRVFCRAFNLPGAAAGRGRTP